MGVESAGRRCSAATLPCGPWVPWGPGAPVGQGYSGGERAFRLVASRPVPAPLSPFEVGAAEAGGRVPRPWPAGDRDRDRD